MAADPNNREVLFKMAKLWDKLSVMSRLSQLFPETSCRTAKSRLLPLAAVATVAVVVLVSALTIGPRPSIGIINADSQNAASAASDIFETAVGEQSKISLPDGSEVVLNTNSLVTIEYSDNYRLIRLKRGEIHVVVFLDKTRPLIVISDDRIIQAVGTAFSLNRTTADQLQLIVIEGRVLVGRIDPDMANSTGVLPIGAVPGSVAVTAGQEVFLGSASEEIKFVSPEEVEVRLSWRSGNLVFRGESLESALAEISRYTLIEFEILDEDLKSVEIAGLFRAGDIDGLLATLTANFNVAHQRTQDGRVLLSRL